MRSRAVVMAYVLVALVTAPVAVLLTRAALPTRASAAPPVATASESPPASAPVAHLEAVAQPPPPGPVIGVPADPAAVQGPGYLTFFGWALLDRHTGQLTGSANRETVSNTTESMIKVWIAADYLRHQNGQPPASAVNELYQMIIHSDDIVAHKYYVINGGDAPISELIGLGGPPGTHPPSPAHSRADTPQSPADAVRLGQCVATGKAAGPVWTG